MRRLHVALQRLPSGAAFTGLTALWLHGVDVDGFNPIEIAIHATAGVSGRSGLLLRRAPIDDSEIVDMRGLPATCACRAIADACRRRGLIEAVVIADAALHVRRLTLKELAAWAVANPRRHGIRTLRYVIEQADPASESPMESRLRMLLVLDGLPRPRAQVNIRDSHGTFLGRVDLYYDVERLGIEYDGATHNHSLAADNRRQNRLLQAGIRLLRFTARDVRGDPRSVVRQVRAMLNVSSAGRNRAAAVAVRSSAGTSSKRS